MRCAKARKYMLEMIEREISPALQQQLKRHLQSCPTCQGENDALRELYSEVKGLPLPQETEPLGSDFLGLIRQRIRAEGIEPSPSRWSRWGWKIPSLVRRPLLAYTSLVVVVGLAIAGILLWYSYSQRVTVDLSEFTPEEVEQAWELISPEKEVDMELIALLDSLSPEEITSFTDELKVEVEPDLILSEVPILASGYLNSGYFYDDLSDLSPEEIEQIVQQLSVKEPSNPSPQKQGGGA
ncbi:MAG: zf-HC2 domain-containing protein [Acidobacteriota bacterium]